jgi:hypothetical protein
VPSSSHDSLSELSTEGYWTWLCDGISVSQFTRPGYLCLSSASRASANVDGFTSLSTAINRSHVRRSG